MINIIFFTVLFILFNISSFADDPKLLSFDQCKNIARKISICHSYCLKYEELEERFGSKKINSDDYYEIEPSQSEKIQEIIESYGFNKTDTVKPKDFISISELTRYNLWNNELFIFKVTFDSSIAHKSVYKYKKQELSYIIGVSRKSGYFFVLHYRYRNNSISKEDAKNEFSKMYKYCIKTITTKEDAKMIALLYLDIVENISENRIILENNRDDYRKYGSIIFEPMFEKYDSLRTFKYPGYVLNEYICQTWETYDWKYQKAIKDIFYLYKFLFFSDGSLYIEKHIDYIIPRE